MYVLLLAATAGMLFTAAVGRGLVGPEHLVARHWQSAIWSVLLVLLGHTVVLFYFLATGKQLRVLMQGSGRPVNHAWLAELRLFKARVFPWVMAAQFTTIATFVIGGGVLVGAVPRPVHAALGLLALTANLVGAAVEIAYIGRNSRLIHAIEREYLPPATAPDTSRA
jgi:hypothetical protein